MGAVCGVASRGGEGMDVARMVALWRRYAGGHGGLRERSAGDASTLVYYETRWWRVPARPITTAF